MTRPSVMRAIVSWSLTYRFLVVAAAVALMAFGAAIIRSSAVDVFPEFAPPQVEIQTVCLGLSTSDVESLVTVPLEQALDGIDGLDDLRSTLDPAAVRRRAGLQAGHRPAARPGSWSRNGWRSSRPACPPGPARR